MVIASLTLVNQAYSAVEIEAMAATHALEFALEVNIDRVVVKGDSKMVVQALMSKNSSLASYGLLVQDVYVFVRNFFELSYSHTKRDINKVAHNLVKLAVNFSDCVVWLEDAPPSVIPFV